jgi:hypothetical protein
MMGDVEGAPATRNNSCTVRPQARSFLSTLETKPRVALLSLFFFPRQAGWGDGAIGT